jgi:CheY-like chemotaxis protein
MNGIAVLLVEDDPGDVLLIQEAFAENALVDDLSVVGDGEEAMAYLRREGRFADAARPDLVLLDLNLPRKNGREVLAESKADPDLGVIPIVVLTTSSSEEDVLGSYRLHANAFITKPPDFERFVEVVHRIDEFFAGLVRLPPRDPPPHGAR